MDPLYGQKTTALKKDNLSNNWILLDAKGRVLGRLVSFAAKRLMGKHLACYQPGFAAGDSVVIINAKHVKVTGNKTEQKVYHRYSGHPGGLKKIKYEVQLEKDSTQIIRHALQGMLPKTKFGKKLLGRVRIFEEGQHNLSSQNPTATSDSSLKEG